VSRLLKLLPWLAVAAVGAGAMAYVAINRGEQSSAAWLLTAAI